MPKKKNGKRSITDKIKLSNTLIGKRKGEKNPFELANCLDIMWSSCAYENSTVLLNFSLSEAENQTFDLPQIIPSQTLNSYTP